MKKLIKYGILLSLLTINVQSIFATLEENAPISMDLTKKSIKIPSRAPEIIMQTVRILSIGCTLISSGLTLYLTTSLGLEDEKGFFSYNSERGKRLSVIAGGIISTGFYCLNKGCKNYINHKKKIREKALEDRKKLNKLIKINTTKLL